MELTDIEKEQVLTTILEAALIPGFYFVNFEELGLRIKTGEIENSSTTYWIYLKLFADNIEKKKKNKPKTYPRGHFLKLLYDSNEPNLP